MGGKKPQQLKSISADKNIRMGEESVYSIRAAVICRECFGAACRLPLHCHGRPSAGLIATSVPEGTGSGDNFHPTEPGLLFGRGSIHRGMWNRGIVNENRRRWVVMKTTLRRRPLSNRVKAQGAIRCEICTVPMLIREQTRLISRWSRRWSAAIRGRGRGRALSGALGRYFRWVLGADKRTTTARGHSTRVRTMTPDYVILSRDN